MTQADQIPEPGKATPLVWTGRVLSGLFIVFMLGASITPKLFMPDISHETLEALGWPVKYNLLIAGIELTGVVLYAFPRTAIVGAIFLTGLLGGAMATQIRVDNPLFSHILFSVYLGLFLWCGLWLRDPRLRALLLAAR